MKKALIVIALFILVFAAIAEAVRVSPIQTNFTAGELSPKLLGRVDIDRYANGAETLENFLIAQYGGAERRPGTKFVAKAKEIIGIDDAFTKLLLRCNGDDAGTTFTDEAGKTVTTVGNAQLDTAQKKFGTASGLFDGTGDELTLVDSADWNFGTGDFTIDFWVRFDSVGPFSPTNLMGQYEDANNNWILERTAITDKLRMTFEDGGVVKGQYTMTSEWDRANDVWYHLAFVRNGTIGLIFIDGVSQTLTENTAFAANDVGDMVDTLHVADAGVGTVPLDGWLDEIRVSKGIARWTSNFTPPTQEYGPVTPSAVRIIPFQFSVTQAYIIELGDLYMRFYRDNGRIETASVPTELVTPYTEAQLFDLQFAQTADIMYITHPSHEPRKLTRTSHTAWTLTEVDFIRGPFLDTNITAVTMTPTADAGNDITITASAATFTTDSVVESLIRIKSGVVKLDTFTSTTVVVGDVQAEVDGTAGNLATGPAAVTDWALGSWSDTLSWPKSVTFYENRVAYAYSANQPQTIWMSVTGDYENMTAGATAADALIYSIASNQVNVINWLLPTNVLAVGTFGGIFSLSSGSDNLALTPTNVRVPRQSTFGAAELVPFQIGAFIYYLQRNDRTIREFASAPDIEPGEIIDRDVTILAEHITESGIVDMAYAQSPKNILWCVRDDGEMATLTREIDQQVVGWSRQVTGLDSAGGGKFESVAVIPAPGIEYDEVWVVVNRIIGGSVVRYVEYFVNEVFDDQEDAFFVDSGLSLDSPITLTGATQANPVVITATAHGLSDADEIKIRNVAGMTELNGNTYKVANKTTNGFEITDTSDVDIDGTGFTAYTSGGEARKLVSSVTGLDHLEGETVAVLTDGVIHADATVANGTITLSDSFSEIHAGLAYTSTGKTLRPEAGSLTGTAQGKIKRIYKVVMRLFNSQGGTVGTDTIQDALPYDDTDFLTDDIEMPFPGGYDTDGQITFIQDEPLPFNVIAIVPKMNVTDD